MIKILLAFILSYPCFAGITTTQQAGTITFSGENYLSLAGQALTASPVNLSGTNVTNVLPMTKGGTNANNTASLGAIPYSTASAIALLAPGSTGQVLRSGGAGAPTWTSETFPATTTINQLLYSSAANTVTGLATVNTGALVTSSTGVPSITSGSVANRLLRTTGSAVTFAQAALATDVSGTMPFANGGTGAPSNPVNRIIFSSGSTFVSSATFLFDTATTRFSVGGVGSAKIASVVPSGTDVGIQSYCEGTNNCVQVRNNSAYNLALLSANDANTFGVLVGAERSRGTQTSRTQALSGDIGLNLYGTCYTGSGSSAGGNALIQYVLSENCTGSANGGEIVLSTTPNGTTALVERLRITNDGLIKSPFGFMNDTSGSQPTCDSSHRGLTWLVRGGIGVADLFQVCMKNAADAYNWETR